LFTQTLKLSATSDATRLTVNGIGAGRITASKSGTNIGTPVSYINAYFGKKGAIDLVVQDMKEVDMRETADRRGTNVFTHYLAGLKTFADGKKKFLNVKIAV
jgi:hypothetical protein